MSRTYTITLPFVAVLVAAILASVYCCSQVSFASDEALAISVTTETSEVELGRAFPLTVVRMWGKSLDPSAFDERSLSPLVTRLQSTSLREDGARVEESRRYVAYAFTPGLLVLPAISLRAASGFLHDDVTTAASEPLRLHVRTALDPKSPGEPEGPGPMLPVPRRWLPWAIGTAVTLGLALVVARRRTRAGSRTPVPRPAPVGPGPEIEALAMLARLRGRDGAGADIVEASDVVRTYAARRFGVHAGEMTSSELLASLTSMCRLSGPKGRTPRVPVRELGAVFNPSDLVKFAEHAPTNEERSRALDAAEAFVLATGATP